MEQQKITMLFFMFTKKKNLLDQKPFIWSQEKLSATHTQKRHFLAYTFFGNKYTHPLIIMST